MGLEGNLVVLREEQEQDLLFLRRLRNDLETQAWSKTLPPDYTEVMYRKRYEEREFSYDRNDGRFIIEEKKTQERCGTTSYVWLEPRWSASIGIMVAKKFWGTGIAFDAQEVLLKFLFEELGLRVVRLYTHSGNQAAVKLAQKAGFKISGWQRKSIFKNGSLYDNLLMDLLREEYYDRHPEIQDQLPRLVENG
ncbi:MAG: GNAT family N-acetyltransferase [Anaerolineales bacterium]|nr:GNAT family N-acetyltransferase [Anaerolineales bacterium]